MNIVIKEVKPSKGEMKMDIMERIDLMRGCDLIDEKGYQDLCEILAQCKQIGVLLTEENAGVMITHIGAAFKRITTKEIVEPLDIAVIDQLKQEESYPAALKLIEIFKENLQNVLSDQEYNFILVHLMNVLENSKNEEIMI